MTFGLQSWLGWLGIGSYFHDIQSLGTVHAKTYFKLGKHFEWIQKLIFIVPIQYQMKPLMHVRKDETSFLVTWLKQVHDYEI